MGPTGAHAVIQRSLRAAELPCLTVGDGRLATVLTGQRKRSIPVIIEVGDRTVRLVSPFVVAPDEGVAAVYRRLMRRNLTAGPAYFALDGDDLVIVATWPLAAFDAAAFDVLLGRMLTLSDENFDAALVTGFASYLAYEQQWRRRAGLPPNPIDADEATHGR